MCVSAHLPSPPTGSHAKRNVVHLTLCGSDVCMPWQVRRTKPENINYTYLHAKYNALVRELGYWTNYLKEQSFVVGERCVSATSLSF